jgi:hypothetical protein
MAKIPIELISFLRFIYSSSNATYQPAVEYLDKNTVTGLVPQ